MVCARRFGRVVCGLLIVAGLLLSIDHHLRSARADENQSVNGADACTLGCRQTYNSCRQNCDPGDSDCQRSCSASLTSCLGTCN